MSKISIAWLECVRNGHPRSYPGYRDNSSLWDGLFIQEMVRLFGTANPARAVRESWVARQYGDADVMQRLIADTLRLGRNFQASEHEVDRLSKENRELRLQLAASQGLCRTLSEFTTNAV